MKKINHSIVRKHFMDKQRFSKLSYNGHKKISRLERKTALIAFSIEEVYALAELGGKCQKGGAAVIMGSLSPEKQEIHKLMFISLEMLIIWWQQMLLGWELNMDIQQINFFSSLMKFDGKKRRRLRTTEISQIAGRAGRFKNGRLFWCYRRM